MSTQRSSLSVLLEGRGPLTLRPADHLATGGEGTLYRAHDTVVKVYTDTAKMLRDCMDVKLATLVSFKHPYIVAPEGLVRDVRGALIGFYMPYTDGEPLTRVFTNSFWKRVGFDTRDASAVVDRMREALQYVHGRHALMVDPNELNWLVRFGSGGYEPRAIDVDSWAFGSFRPSVIMPSIRDFHTQGFSEKTDWFAWGIVTFQVYTGIHPYKGTLAGYAPQDMAARMQAHASVFRREIRLNNAVRDLRTIPALLLDWYEAVFEHGERTVPPSPFDTGAGRTRPVKVLRMVTNTHGALVYRKLYEQVNDPAVAVYPVGIVRLRSGTAIDLRTQQVVVKSIPPDAEVHEIKDGWVVASVRAGHLVLTYHGMGGVSEECLLSVGALRAVSGAGRLFAIGERGLQEVQIRRVGNRPVASVGNVWPVMPYATKWFDGVGVMDALGASHLIVPFGERGVAIVRVSELDRERVVAGESGGRIVVVTTVSQDCTYKRFTIVFDSAMQTYQVRVRSVDSPDQNVVVLPKGVIALIEDDGELTITVPTSGGVNVVADKDISTDMQLARWGNKVVYLKGGAVWSLEMM